MLPGNAPATPDRARRRPEHDSDASRLLDLATVAPAVRTGFVRRPALVDGLTVGAPAALSLIVAPAGYGKSTLLSDWAEQDEREFTWLALGQCEPGMVSALTALPPSGAPDGLAHLISRLRARDGTFVLVLDDAHLVAPEVLRGVIPSALAELPEGSTLALASRTELGLAVGRLRAHRQLAEVRAEQLAMGPSEALELLRAAGVEPGPDDLDALVAKTEGWPAALYLAALALGEREGCVGDFGGHHHLVSEYLDDEVLADLPADLASFAIETSVLDELSGPVCDAILERDGSAIVLERLAYASPLLAGVDVGHSCYRWHSLMRERLQARLRKLRPAHELALRVRASGWYRSSGDTLRAIDQAASGGNAELTGELLWGVLLPYVTTGQGELVRGWLRDFGPDVLAGDVRLSLSAALSAVFSGDLDGARRWSLAAGAGIDRAPRRADAAAVRSRLALIDAIGAPDGIERMGEVAQLALDAESEDSRWRALCLLLGGTARHLCGDRTTAEAMLESGTRLSGNSAPMLAALCLSQSGMIAIEREDWQLAAELTDRATMVTEEWGLGEDPLSAIVHAAAAAARAHRGRIDEAKRDLRAGIDVLAVLGDFVPWYGAQARILLAHASLWLADVVGARTLLAEASRFARRTAGATIFSSWFDDAWAYMDTLAETSLAGPSSLTIAELRILRFLPSHRSFREIAEQLGVSANTVKTQAHAVYRKLGAASRSEAVERAREAGLLGA